MRFLYTFIFVLLSFYGIAATSRDSIGVENQNGNQIILHKVQQKETYYSIARLYNVAPRSILESNKNISLHIGTVIKVPTTRPFAVNAKQISPAAVSENILEYKVGPKEFLYMIARRFNTTVEDIKQLNNLKSERLSIGQVLKIRPGASTPAIVPSGPATPAPSAETPSAPEVEKPKIPTSRLGLSERSERGVAVWISDENLDGTKMLALHRTAPVGTVVKVTNPMTDRVTFVKVVGKYTENETTKDVIIVITKATAELLGALDKRFQVTIDYGIPNE